MYCLTDEQVEYILNDIRRNGVETEDLQLNLLDHICCIVEQEFKEGDDFEHFYKHMLGRFSTGGLRQVEDETIQLLTFKNYYVMKKLLIACGAISAFELIIGSILKLLHMAGASFFLVTGIMLFTLLFLPLLTLLKMKETKTAGEKMIAIAALVSAMLFCWGTMSLVMHWPAALMMWIGGVAVAALIVAPAYFVNGIRRPETRLNTILVTVLIVCVAGLQFTLLDLKALRKNTQASRIEQASK